jgi:hypothetical protein
VVPASQQEIVKQNALQHSLKGLSLTTSTGAELEKRTHHRRPLMGSVLLKEIEK